MRRWTPRSLYAAISRNETRVTYRARFGFVRNGACWDWNGRTRDAPTKRIWKAVHGSYPPRGVNVCHTCDRRKCGRPSHLWLGTQSDNMQDAIKKGRAWHLIPVKRAAIGAKLRVYKLAWWAGKTAEQRRRRGLPAA